MSRGGARAQSGDTAELADLPMSLAVTSRTGGPAPARRRRRRGSSPPNPPPVVAAGAAATPSWTSRSMRPITPRLWSLATSETRTSGPGEGGDPWEPPTPEPPIQGLTLPLWHSLYPPISSDGARQKYKQEFDTDLKRYKQLCAEMDGVNDRINQLSKQLDSISEDSPQYQVRALGEPQGHCGVTGTPWGIGDGCCGVWGCCGVLGVDVVGVLGCCGVLGMDVVGVLGCYEASGMDIMGSRGAVGYQDRFCRVLGMDVTVSREWVLWSIGDGCCGGLGMLWSIRDGYYGVSECCGVSGWILKGIGNGCYGVSGIGVVGHWGWMLWDLWMLQNIEDGCCGISGCCRTLGTGFVGCWNAAGHQGWRLRSIWDAAGHWGWMLWDLGMLQDIRDGCCGVLGCCGPPRTLQGSTYPIVSPLAHCDPPFRSPAGRGRGVQPAEGPEAGELVSVCSRNGAGLERCSWGGDGNRGPPSPRR